MNHRLPSSVLLGILVVAAGAAVAAAPVPSRAAGASPGAFSIDIGTSELVFADGSIRPAAAGGGVTIVLERGTGSGELLSWALTGARRDASLVLYDTAGKPVARYHLERAWPSKVEIGGLTVSGPGVQYRAATLSAAALRTVG